MSVRNAGTTIREARLKAGLSQEKLSDGICSVLSLSRIENGTAGVSPSTFQALMARAGAPCEAFPIFANRKDFDCYYTLKRARFYLDSWQLREASAELEKIEFMNFADNKYYYQEWLFLQCKLQFRSGLGNHVNIYDTLLNALHISHYEIDFFDFRSLLLSINEIQILTAIAQEALYMNNLGLCLGICTQISSYLENSQITFMEKNLLLAENAVVYAKYLIATGDYSGSLKITEKFHKKMVENSDHSTIHELTFLSGLAYYYEKNLAKAMLRFKTAFFSAHSIESCYATICRNYLISDLNLDLPDELMSLPDIPLIPFAEKKAIDSSCFSDGTYDLFSPDVLTTGTLIRELRIEQNISQQTLCQGLCSKSKLSKIENGTLQPDIALAQSLLQRLGISDAIFTFYGNAHESKLQNLRQLLTNTITPEMQQIQTLTQEMLNLSSSKDTFYIQYASYRQACCICDSNTSAETLYNILGLSLNKFDMNSICQYRLSWLELTILNNYCNSYCETSPAKGTLFLYKLLEYFNSPSLDILALKRIFPVTMNILIKHLYNQKRFAEILELSSYYSSATIRYTTYLYGVLLANYAQALGETQDMLLCQKYAHYSYYNLLITNHSPSAKHLKDMIYDDFNVILI